MTKFKLPGALLGAVAALSVFVATPALAQHMIDEPGMYAFYHPNGDLGLRSTRPAPEAMASARDGNIARLRMGPVSRPVLNKRLQSRSPY
jgi:hypothetical protein